eukprot:s2754_g19.t1
MSGPIDSSELAQHLARAQQRALDEECRICRELQAELQAEREMLASELTTMQLALQNATLQIRNETMQGEVLQARMATFRTVLESQSLEVESMAMRMQAVASEYEMERSARD